MVSGQSQLSAERATSVPVPRHSPTGGGPSLASSHSEPSGPQHGHVDQRHRTMDIWGAATGIVVAGILRVWVLFSFFFSSPDTFRGVGAVALNQKWVQVSGRRPPPPATARSGAVGLRVRFCVYSSPQSSNRRDN